MKFIAIAKVFAAFAVTATSASDTNYLRKLSVEASEDAVEIISFIDASPEPEECKNGYKKCECRNGMKCQTTKECTKAGVSGSCDIRKTNERSYTDMSCRDGSYCINGNTACEDGSKCKVRYGNDDTNDDEFDGTDGTELTSELTESKRKRKSGTENASGCVAAGDKCDASSNCCSGSGCLSDFAGENSWCPTNEEISEMAAKTAII